jgi:hypothetical protein
LLARSTSSRWNLPPEAQGVTIVEERRTLVRQFAVASRRGIGPFGEEVHAGGR